MRPEIARALCLYRELNAYHRKLYEFILRAKQGGGGAAMSQGERVDLAFVAREGAKLADDCRKEFTALQELLEGVVCAVWVQDGVNDPDATSSTISGELASGSPDVRQMVSLPREKNDPVAFKKLCNHLGIMGRAFKNRVFKLHWPSLVDYVSERLASGKPLPPGVKGGKTYSLFRLKPLRRRSGVDITSADLKGDSCERDEVEEAKIPW